MDVVIRKTERRIEPFKAWRYRKYLTIRWTNKITNEGVYEKGGNNNNNNNNNLDLNFKK
jgi:hypothetical protein